MEIVKGNPIPKRKSGNRRKYPFAKMDIGDSFDIPMDKFVSTATIYTSARYAGVWASVRKLDDLGVYRVWRIR